MFPTVGQNKARQERGIVLVMVVGVLSMLFIIGATLLIVSRFEGQTAETAAHGRNIKSVGVALTDPIIVQLGEDAVGKDGIPYNSGWHVPANPLSGDLVGTEDYANYAGFAGNGSIRNGDLLLSSIEPYDDGGTWRQFAASWPLDLFTSVTNRVWVPEVDLTHGPSRDADGDGIRDASDSQVLADLADMFGGSFRMDLRVVPHGGMVLLDPLTHPSLLLHAIHPRDFDPSASGFDDIAWSDFTALLSDPDFLALDATTDEGRLRRRFMLPPFLPEPQSGDYSVAAPALARRLPVTTGFTDPADPTNWDEPINHWWPFNDQLVTGDNDAWKQMLRPGDAPTDKDDNGVPIYNAAADTYDRRRLITTINSDDLLRRWRDEAVAVGSAFPYYYNLINPDPAGTVDPNAYGLDPAGSGSLLFNTPGLRSQFSLRDVLEPNWTGSQFVENVPTRRALQLTAYYLAMIQHTSVPGADPASATPADRLEQLRTATQLAVNTIDFADSDLKPSYIQLTSGFGPPVQVLGVEKQPYITEAYARVVYLPRGPAYTSWEGTPDLTESLYAVELYNPYGVDLPLTNYQLYADSTLRTVDLSSITIKPYRYAIVCNNAALAQSYIGNTVAYTSGPEQNVYELDFSGGGKFEIDQNEGIQLRVTPAGITGLGLSPPSPIAVDVMKPSAADLATNRWARRDTSADPSHTAPAGSSDRHVWDTSLQRHKELEPGSEPFEYPPHHWRFTLSRQLLTPVADTGPAAWYTDTSINRTKQHNLMGTGNPINRVIVAMEAQGVEVPRFGGGAPVIPSKPPVAPFPVLTSDRGIDPKTGGTVAFPTTGSLLLVTRYAHTPDGPITVAATMYPHESDRSVGAVDPLQMERFDNGHLPVFDMLQKSRDLADVQGRLDVPWGQLVFDYFTALPLEELIRPLDLSGFGYNASGSRRPMSDLTEDEFRTVYSAWFAEYPFNFLGYPEYASYPLVEGWSDSMSPLGTRVWGRVNIGVAPWRVLDGLPMLLDSPMVPISPLSVPEIGMEILDPIGYDITGTDHQPAGKILMSLLVDDFFIDGGTFEYPTVSPDLARYMVSYRENRAVEGRDVSDGTVGFATVGELCNVIPKIPITVQTQKTGPSGGNPPEDLTLTNVPLGALRTHEYEAMSDDPSTTVRPYSYLGYLQLITPVVRLQDWATVKNHAFTIYATIQSTNEPRISLRTQVTVDRTRSLYSPGELPARISELEPIGYFNAKED